MRKVALIFSILDIIIRVKYLLPDFSNSLNGFPCVSSESDPEESDVLLRRIPGI